ncbi:MAG: hypothetical protein JRI33_00615 [Deltaproteobacteria bacterium]|nr:hypothetical protein [Deltaproteobacteria bacterium]
MGWQLFRVSYELHSPLHIGYHKLSNVQRTRYYVPARNLWGAVTECLTRSGFQTRSVSQGTYLEMGNWVKNHFRFTYFFINEGNVNLSPHYEGNRMHYGNLSKAEFDRRYLDSHVTTALDAATTSAEGGSLHEVEFIAPYPRQDAYPGRRTSLAGWVFLDEEGREFFGTEKKWKTGLENLQVGGERRYGFGRLRFLSIKPDSTLNGFVVEPAGYSPSVYLKANDALPAHVLVKGVHARGEIEPLVGRETSRSHAFGVNLTRGMMCWVPGSLLVENAKLQLEPEGYWRSVAGS